MEPAELNHGLHCADVMLALPAQGTSLTDLLQHHPVAAVAALFGAGLATSLTPCIYPMIPITAGITRRASVIFCVRRAPIRSMAWSAAR